MNQERLLRRPHFSVADRLEATLEANLRRATRLRHAILKRAFTPTESEKVYDAQDNEMSPGSKQ